MRSRHVQIALCFAAVYLIWGSTFFAVRFAVEDVPPLFLAGNRFALAGLIVLAFASRRGAALPRVPWLDAIVPGLLFFAGANGAVCWAEANGLPSGTTAMLIATEPLWVALFSRIASSESSPLSWLQRIGLVGGFFGTALLVRGATQGVGWVAAVVVFGAMAWAIGSLLVAHRARRRTSEPPPDPIALAGLHMVVGGIGCLVLSVGLGESVPRLSSIGPAAIAAFFYLVVFGSIVAFLAYTFLLRNVATTRVATYAYVNPVVAVLLGTLVGESIDGGALVAMAIVLGAVVLTLRPKPRDPPRMPRLIPRSAHASSSC